MANKDYMIQALKIQIGYPCAERFSISDFTTAVEPNISLIDLPSP